MEWDGVAKTNVISSGFKVGITGGDDFVHGKTQAKCKSQYFCSFVLKVIRWLACFEYIFFT